ncbi:MAG: hypothetical protein ACMUIE_07755 [Thermoplasmatota archaeon]
MKRKYNEWKEFKEGFGYLRTAIPYLLSHHPHCTKYRRDVLNIGRLKLCWGCIVTYPVAIAVVILILHFGTYKDYPWYLFILMGVAFGSFEFISLWRKGTGLRHRMIKIFLGIGIALVTVGIFMIPVHILLRLYFLFAGYTAAGAAMSLRLRGMEKKCKRCEWKGNWYQCPGFEELNSKLEKKGLLKRDKDRKWDVARKKSKVRGT